MDVREKLVELIAETLELYPSEREELADGLIAKGVTVQEWISVKDRLPEEASTVLAIDSYGTICSAYYAGRWQGGGDLEEDAAT